MLTGSFNYPLSLRQKLAALWGAPEVANEWFPASSPEAANTPRIISTMRAFVAERQKQPTDTESSNLGNLRGLFKSLDVNEQDSGVHVRG